MDNKFFTTDIPIYVIIFFALGLLLIFLELKFNFKGMLAIVGGAFQLLGIVLCFITGTPIIEIVFLLIVSVIILMFMISTFVNKKNVDIAFFNKNKEDKGVVNSEIETDKKESSTIQNTVEG